MITGKLLSLKKRVFWLNRPKNETSAGNGLDRGDQVLATAFTSFPGNFINAIRCLVAMGYPLSSDGWRWVSEGWFDYLAFYQRDNVLRFLLRNYGPGSTTLALDVNKRCSNDGSPRFIV